MEQWGTLKNCWLVINYSVEHEKGKSPPGLGTLFHHLSENCDNSFPVITEIWLINTFEVNLALK